MLGRLFQVTIDAVLVSALVAGGQRAAGVEFKASSIDNEYARTAVTSYLRVGEWAVDTAAEQLRKYPDLFPKKR
ncbi:hypothetical protein BC831DRAFT_402223 [Entophlyctis helioformis]|nr:hypothetical protein BC831DRAFT_402223 [Entophlyctis helioformis]